MLLSGMLVDLVGKKGRSDGKWLNNLHAKLAYFAEAPEE